MSAYLIVEDIITDASKFEEYRVRLARSSPSTEAAISQREEPTGCLKEATGLRRVEAP